MTRACCDEDRCTGLAEYSLGDAAKQEALDGAEAAGVVDDQIAGARPIERPSTP